MDEDGRCRLILGALRDTTDEDAGRRTPEDLLLRALREQRTELLTLIEATPRPLLLLDAQQRILRTNRATEEMFGWRAGDLAGRALLTLSADAGGMLDGLLAAALGGTPSERVTRVVLGLSREGQVFPVEMAVAAAPGPDGGRFVVMFSPAQVAEVAAGPFQFFAASVSPQAAPLPLA